MPDSAMSERMCLDDAMYSTLVDGGYPASRLEFIKSDGSTQHASGRTTVERYFSRVKMLWGMVGSVYWRGKRWHNMVIRASFILTNMVVIYEGSIVRSY